MFISLKFLTLLYVIVYFRCYKITFNKIESEKNMLLFIVCITCISLMEIRLDNYMYMYMYEQELHVVLSETDMYCNVKFQVKYWSTSWCLIKCFVRPIAIEVYMWDIMKYVLSGLDQIVIEVYMWDINNLSLSFFLSDKIHKSWFDFFDAIIYSVL